MFYFNECALYVVISHLHIFKTVESYPLPMFQIKYIYIYAFGRCFFFKGDLHCIQSMHFASLCIPMESNSL